MQVLMFVTIYWLRIDANFINPGVAYWYRRFVKSELVLWGLGPFITFGVTATVCVTLHWPLLAIGADAVRAAIVTVGVTLVTLPIACKIAFTRWGT